MLKIAITGGTGFIGKKLIEQQVKLGNNPHYLTREMTRNIAGASRFVGDVNSAPEKLYSFLEGVDVFFNCAGELKNEALMYSTHVNGTKNILESIKQIHVQNRNNFHWVQLSSCGAYGQSANNIARCVNEYTKENPSGMYELTKTEADHLIISFAEQHEWFKYTIIRPTNVFGIGMYSTAILRIAKMIRKRFFFYVGNNHSIANFVHVDDVVNAMLLSVNQLKAQNQTFVVSNDCKFSEMVNTIADALLVPPPRLIVNEFLLRKFVAVLGRWFNLPISSSQIDVMVRQTYYDNTKIRTELEWSPSASVLTQFRLYIKTVFNFTNG